MSLEPAEAAECPNCGGRVEPEQDDDLIYYPCGCGQEFGYQRIRQEDSCAAGIPLSHLATLGGTGDEPYGLRTGPVVTEPVFLGSAIPMRPEDN